MYFKKNLGQNFLINNYLIKYISYLIFPKIKSLIIEIGLGNGEISFNLVILFFKYNILIYLIEKDETLFLKFKNYYKYLNAVNLDIFKLKFFIFKKYLYFNYKLSIIGNLPYNISSLILFYLLLYIKVIYVQYFMLQKEFAFKLIINFKKFNKNSIIFNSFYKINKLFEINGKNFLPVTKVNSYFVKFKPLYLNLVKFKDLVHFKNFLKFIFNLKEVNIKEYFFKYNIQYYLDLKKCFYNYLLLFFLFKKKNIFFFNNLKF